MAFNRAKAERSNGFRVASTTLSIIAGLTAIGLVLHMHYPQETKASRPSDAYLWFAHERVEQRPGTVLAEGLPLMRYPGVTHPQTNPVTIEQWGLSHHARGDSRVAIRAANWLVAHQRSDGAWTYNFDFYSEPTAEMMRAPWISGLAQGEGLSLLTRAYRLSGDEKYLTSARTALGPFTKTVEHGGVLRYWHGHPFYEEYPATKPSLVLNGFLSTLIGLKEFADETGDPLAERLWTEGEATAAALITDYSIGEHDSAYALAFRRPGGPPPILAANNGYAEIHVALAREMYDLTGRGVYLSVANAWQGAVPPAPLPRIRLMLLTALAVAIALAWFLVRRRRLKLAEDTDPKEPGAVSAHDRIESDGMSDEPVPSRLD